MNPDLTVVDWTLKLEKLEAEKANAEKQIRDTIAGAKPSNRDVLESMVLCLGNASYAESDDDRQARLRPLADAFANTLTHEPAIRRYKQANLVGDLKGLYNAVAAYWLKEDFQALGRTDESVEYLKRRADAEKKLAGVDHKIESHKGTVLDCFRDGKLPSAINDAAPTSFPGMHADTPDKVVAVALCRSFLKNWRERSAVCNEPVSVHGEAIRLMPSPLKYFWVQEYQKLGLKPATSGAAFSAKPQYISPPVVDPKDPQRRSYFGHAGQVLMK